MAFINLDAIMSKVVKHAGSKEGKSKIQDKVDEYIANGVEKTNAGSNVVTEEDYFAIAEELMVNLRNAASASAAVGDLPESVADHFNSLRITASQRMRDKKLKMSFVRIEISFTDDLSRQSLISTPPRSNGRAYISSSAFNGRTGRGVENIVASFEYGYHARGVVHGFWESAERNVWSVNDRVGLHLIGDVIDDFNTKYGDMAKASLLWDYRLGL